MSAKAQSNLTQNYYPTEQELKDPRSTRRVLQQVLKQHYDLARSHAEALQTVDDLKGQLARVRATPTPMGPTNSQILGLPVTPIDTNSLANGATLKWNKATGSFIFS